MLEEIQSLIGIFRTIGKRRMQLPIRLKANKITMVNSLEVRRSLKRKINIAIILILTAGQSILQLK